MTTDWPDPPKPTPEYLLIGALALAGFLIICIFLGFAAKKRSSSFELFLVGGRDIGPIITGLALCATWMSGWACLGLMGITYWFGWPGMWLAGVWTLLGLAPAALITGPKMRAYSAKFGAATVPDVIGIRFDSKLTQAMAAASMIILLMVYSVGQYTAGATAWYAITGYRWEICMLLSASVAFIYLAFGGYTGTQWTLALQGILLTIGCFALGIASLAFIGGPEALNAKLAAQAPELVGLVNPKLSGVPAAQFAADWIGVLATAIMFFTMAIGFPHNVARFLGIRKFTKRDFAIMMAVIAIGGSVPWANLIVGLAARAYFGPKLAGIPGMPTGLGRDAAAPLLAMVIGGVPLSTIYLVAVFAASLSTLAAMVMVMSGNVTRDILGLYMPNLSKKTLLAITRILIPIFALIPLYWAIVRPPPLLAYLMSGAAVGLGSIFFFVVAVSFYWRGATKYGAMACILYGMAMCALGGYYVYTINAWGWGYWQLATFIGCGALYFLVSLVTPKPPKERLDELFG
jgi:sodium/proline symporter